MSHISIHGYKVLHKLGSGSYATVYKAKSMKNPRGFVAVKCIEKANLSASGKDNIINEIKIMKMLNHPHIVKLLDFQWDEKYIYLVLEFCNGGDLSTFIHKRRRLSEKVFQKFIRQLAFGLQFLRSNNICHLDLKPKNLLLVTHPSLSLKIADFGFAQLLSDDAHKVAMRGSPLYMAPEMLLRRDCSAKADLWSVGVISYESLFGKAPLPHTTYCQLVTTVQKQAPIEIPVGQLSPECNDLLSRLLVYEPEARMDFDEFFGHSFIDLEHYPRPESYTKAVELVQMAVRLDYDKEYQKSFTAYCQALQYLLPYVRELEDPDTKEALEKKVLEYTKRAEELKQVFLRGQKNTTREQNLRSEKEVDNASLNHSNQSLLRKMCVSTPAIKSALDMGRIAEMYLAGGDWQQALDTLRGTLAVLVPLLGSEPPGPRKDLLRTQVEEWLSQAENVKILLAVKNSDQSSQEQLDPCCIQ